MKEEFIAQSWSLTGLEMIEADELGMKRHLESERLGYKDKFGAIGGKFLDILGARGEMVFAKATGLKWWKSVNRPNDPDVGKFEVRTGRNHKYGMIVRPDSKDDRPYAHITGTGPFFIVWGWIMAKDAKQSRWLATWGDRPPAYFVPHDALYSINEIELPHPLGHWSDNWLDDPEAKWASIGGA